jgi:ribosomal protein L7Ae-like RNA K-turn-binding protein
MSDEKAKSKLGFLGLLYVAHKVAIGEDLAEHFSKVKLLLMASDATSNQALSLEKKATSAHVPLIKEFTKKELGQALGHDEVTFLGIIDEKAAGAYLKKSAEGVKK